jgi:hypothetical protein
VSETDLRHLQRPPSWAQADMPPPEGAWCAACHGQRWWAERHAPKGWRLHGRDCRPDRCGVLFYGAASVPLRAVVAGVLFWLLIAAALHGVAQRVLGGLR